jgi:2-phosphoglycerate kinase
MRQDLAHVLWIGGSPCAGKSSIAKILGDRYKLATISCDEAFNQEQKKRIVPDRHPTLHKWTTLTWDELWKQPAHVLLDEAVAAYSEHFELILEDLLSLPEPSPIVVEATALLPDCVSRVLLDRHRAIWIVPTEDFQRTHYPNRGPFVKMIVSQCANPEQAFQNWMDRDVAFARWVRTQTQELGLELMIVDGGRTITENTKRVAEYFQLGE